jgi:hypothetical protein
MPPLIVAGLIGAGVYLGLRIASGFLGGLAGSPVSKAEQDPEVNNSRDLAAKDLGPLERDPDTGIYRPARRD